MSRRRSFLALGLLAALPLLSGCAPTMQSARAPVSQQVLEADLARRRAFQQVQEQFNEQVYPRLQTALQGLKLGEWLYSSPCYTVPADQPTDCDPRKGISIEAVGLTTREEVLARLAAAGFDPATAEVSISGPPTFSPAASLPWPVSGAVVSPGSQRVGSRLTVQVRLWNLTLQPLTVFSGDRTIGILILDSQGTPITFRGQLFYFDALHIRSVAPLDSTTLTQDINLTQFNPDFPLPPGHYTLRVHLGDLDLSLGRLLWLPSETKTIEDLTLADVPFDIIP